MSGSIVFIIGSVVLLVGGGIMAAICHFLVKRYKKKIDVIASAPQTTVGALRAGLHKASGTSVALDKPVISPLTQTECVFYHFRVEELQTSRRSGKNPNNTAKTNPVQSSWQTVVSDKQAVACGLQDATGLARLDLLGAEMVLQSSKPKESSFFQSCPPDLKETLERRYDFSTKGLLLSKSLRFTETLIRPGDKLFVLGNVQTKDSEPPMFVKGEQSFIISDKDESELLRHLRRFMVGGYVVMGVVGVIMLLVLGLVVSEWRSTNPARQQAALANKQPAEPGPAPKKGKNSPKQAAAKQALVAQSINEEQPAKVPAPKVPEAVPAAPKDRDEDTKPPALKPVPEAKLTPPPGKQFLPLNTKVHIVSVATGRLFEAERAKNNKDGSVLVLRSKEGLGAPHRQWIIKRAPETRHFMLVNVESNRLLDAERLTSNRDGTKVQLFGTDLQGNKERLWNISGAGGDAFYIISAANGRYLDADEAALDKKGASVRLRGTEGQDKPGRKWLIVKVGP